MPRFDIYKPIALSCGRYLRVCEARVRHEWNWSAHYVVEIEAVEMPSSSAFDISITFDWEALSDDTETPPRADELFIVARRIVREHFDASPCPRCGGQRWGLTFQHPQTEVLNAD